MTVAKGVQVPYPEPTSEAATIIGKANRRSGTKPERLVRSELHRRGRRFRKDHLVRTPEVWVRVDVCFTRARVAVFVHGCFWHCCPEHGRIPKVNQAYWGPKLAANRARDERVERALRASGWVVLRIWEHEPIAAAADRVELALASANV
ncbi:MAG: very short patch repair endonuclease [Acidimicrobiia bacterium]